ncbi:MAG: RNA polymerase sigma factor [Minisyncoccales bacterium]
MNRKKEFSKIYDEYINKIYRFIFLKVSSEDIAKDLCSETFLRGWEVYQDNPNIKNPSALLYRIAQNLIIDYYREKERTNFISTELVSLADPRPNLEEKAIINSDLNLIKTCLANLKDEYQNVIIWRYLDDLSIEETAKLLGRTEENTRVLLHRALKALRNEVNKKSKKEIKEA